MDEMFLLNNRRLPNCKAENEAKKDNLSLNVQRGLLFIFNGKGIFEEPMAYK
jgi:hypothetical protein